MSDTAPEAPAPPASVPPRRPPPSPPQAGVELCRAADIADGGTRAFEFGEPGRRFKMFVVRRADRLYAYANDCPHIRGALDWPPGDFLTPDGSLIVCAMHGALFEIEDGYCIAGPCHRDSLTAVPVRVVDGMVVVAGG